MPRLRHFSLTALLPVMLVGLCLTCPTQAGEPVKESTWKNASRKPITAKEFDDLILQGLEVAKLKPAPIISDESFLRRVHLDLLGKPPTVEEIQRFTADQSANKRAKLIDTLLDSDQFARHWASYFQDVISARLVGFQGRQLARPFERWMADQLKKNRPWSEITREMLTASGVARYDDTEGKAGPSFFLAAHTGADAVVEQAAETSRIFLGIQINCAQCHDHPFDSWKREQFHELAAFFARVRSRPVREDGNQGRFVGMELVSMDRKGPGRGFGGGFGGRFGAMEYRMPGKNSTNPRFGGTVVHPRSLDGKSPGRGLSDKDRRKALVDSLVSPENYWFSAAFVNRISGVLLGQAFYLPVDDLGPQREAVQGPVLARLAGSFAGSGHDIKALFRVILNSQTYQRESKVGATRGDHLQFAYAYPTRLRPSALSQSLNNALGPVGFGGPGGGARRPGGGGFRGFGPGGLDGMIRSEFGFDPSLKNDDVEGSIPQSLILMNNPQVNQRIRATGNTVLARILSRNEKDEPAIEAIYLRTLNRKPTASELSKCLAHLKKVGKRGEAYEDLLWALINSTEFQTRR